MKECHKELDITLFFCYNSKIEEVMKEEKKQKMPSNDRKDENEKSDEIKFSLDEVEKTFTQYRLNQILDGVVVLKRDDGVIFNIGGKSDAFIPIDDFLDFESIKVGERFKVIITKMKNENGLIEASKSQADAIIIGTQEARLLKLGSTFSFVVTSVNSGGLVSKLGQYNIFVPNSEISSKAFKSNRDFLNQRLEAIVTEIKEETKNIICSVKMLQERIEYNNQLAFWNSIFVNKLVSGKVERIVPFGAFINVDGVTCLCHISDVSHSRIKNVDEILKIGETYTFKVIKVDKESKRISLSFKAMTESPKVKLMQELIEGEIQIAEVVKILPFGAIMQLTNGVEGLLHISDATNLSKINIFEIVKLGDKIEVVIKKIDMEKERISLALPVKISNKE